MELLKNPEEASVLAAAQANLTAPDRSHQSCHLDRSGWGKSEKYRHKSMEDLPSEETHVPKEDMHHSLK